MNIKNCILKPEVFKGLSKPAQDVIGQMELNASHGENVFGNMCKFAIDENCKSSKELNEKLRPLEEEILATREANGERVKTSNGKWLKSKVSQYSTYSSNKAVVGKALDNGIVLKSEKTGGYKRKTELEKLTKQKVESTRTELTARERVEKAMKTIRTNWDGLSSDEKESVRTIIMGL